MRVRHIKITKWRHFENIELSISESAPVVCLVGGNGTGKSQILELIAACAQEIGLSHGFASGRGNPFNESAEFEVTVYIAPHTVPTIDDPDLDIPEQFRDLWAAWDRTLLVRRSATGANSVIAGGATDVRAEQFGQHLTSIIRASDAVHYLMLDADRAYPRIDVPVHELGQAFETDWVTTVKSKSFMLTKNLYEEWFRYLLGTENKENNAHVKAIRLSRVQGKSEPVFVDKMQQYRDHVRSVLPHLLFTGIESQKRQIEFDSTGVSLTFDQLSGGEREIAFLVGQIDRFGLRKGLLLVDEPELHLNYDLLRAWIQFLKSSVDEGQIWLATHSLEVVEVTGQDSTFLLERDEVTRKVSSCTTLSNQPVVTALSRSIGSPAFSISSLSFVLIEGEVELGERERFKLLTGSPSSVRFMESGNCREVTRRIETLKSLASASSQPLKIGGIVDGDWRKSSERTTLLAEGVYTLEVHEIENFFLHPKTVGHVMSSISRDVSVYEGALLLAADRRAGTYIFDAARTDKAFEKFPPPHTCVRTHIHTLIWSDFADLEATCAQIAEKDPQLDAKQRTLLGRHLVVQAKIYERQRSEPCLWKVCEGKEVFRSLVSEMGFASADVAERAMLGAWETVPALIPKELQNLRFYVSSL
ncbi:MAG TPA: AAA family ATPase [Novosphingobium sp.]|nr:AAA family ATPase [Novosphingobium sp.]